LAGDILTKNLEILWGTLAHGYIFKIHVRLVLVRAFLAVGAQSNHWVEPLVVAIHKMRKEAKMIFSLEIGGLHVLVHITNGILLYINADTRTIMVRDDRNGKGETVLVPLPKEKGQLVSIKRLIRIRS
jgi:hypothetical protein